MPSIETSEGFSLVCDKFGYRHCLLGFVGKYCCTVEIAG